MKVTVTGKHIEVTPPLKEHVEKKVSKIEKYFPKPFEVHVVLSVEKKYRHNAEISLIMKGAVIHGKDVTEDMYSSIDGAVEKIEHQVKKHKEKINDRKERPKDKDVEPEGFVEEE